LLAALPQSDPRGRADSSTRVAQRRAHALPWRDVDDDRGLLQSAKLYDVRALAGTSGEDARRDRSVSDRAVLRPNISRDIEPAPRGKGRKHGYVFGRSAPHSPFQPDTLVSARYAHGPKPG